MNLPDSMSHTARNAPRATSPRTLTTLLAFLVLLGAAGTTASIINAQTTSSATRTDVERNRVLLKRVTDLEAMNSREVELHRLRNEELHADICRLIFEVIQVAPSLKNAQIEPCAPPLTDLGG